MEHSLAWLHLDLNCYFASVEQEMQPRLRDRPLAILPVMAETTCCIAVSYEARAFGVRTGMAVKEARRLCPELAMVEARPRVYVEMHHRIAAAIERCVPVEAVLSCDEFVSRLMGSQCEAAVALRLAAQVKQSIRSHAGATLRCSIGLGSNRLLAKIAAAMRKPDGLTAVTREQLPGALEVLSLRDIPGVGERMERRLRRAGVGTVRTLCGLSRERMAALWGGVVGERMWLALQGEDLPAPPVQPLQTISRQHILPPALRTLEGCRETGLKLLQDCVRRMRRRGLEAGGLGVMIYFVRHRYVFEASCPIAPCQDGITLQERFLPLLAGLPEQTPHSLCVALTQLAPVNSGQLFAAAEDSKRARAAEAMDAVRRRYGKDAVFLGSIFRARAVAPQRISFGPPQPLEEF